MTAAGPEFYAMGQRAAAQIIRSQLKLRRNELKRCFEVYTTIHGSGIFKWFQITYEMYQWYKQNFPEINVVAAVKITPDGGIEDATILKLGD